MTRRIVLAVALITAACGGRPLLRVKLTGKQRTITDVYVVFGTGKQYWPELRPGDQRSAAIPESDLAGADITVLYRLDGASQSWRGPNVDARAKSVTIHINTEMLPSEHAITCEVQR